MMLSKPAGTGVGRVGSRTALLSAAGLAAAACLVACLPGTKVRVPDLHALMRPLEARAHAAHITLRSASRPFEIALPVVIAPTFQLVHLRSVAVQHNAQRGLTRIRAAVATGVEFDLSRGWPAKADTDLATYRRLTKTVLRAPGRLAVGPTPSPTTIMVEFCAHQAGTYRFRTATITGHARTLAGKSSDFRERFHFHWVVVAR